MTSRKSNVWHFFYKTNQTTAVCTLCGRNYSRKGRGTTCLRNHLRSLHPVEFLTLSENDIKYVVKKEVTDINLALSQQMQESEADPLEPAEIKFNNADCDEKLALMLVDFSFELIEGQGFINFIRTLQPKYMIQGKIYYENLLCHHIYPKLEAQLHKKLDNLDAYTLSLGYHRENEFALKTLTCYGISRDFQTVKLLLNCKILQSGEKPDEDLMNNNWWPLSQDKIHCVLRVEGTTLGNNLSDCSVQRLKLCIQNAFQVNEPLKQLARKCQEIIEHFKTHPKAREHLHYIHVKRLKREYQPIFDNNHTEWNSIYSQMAILFKMKDSLCVYAEEFNNFVQIYPDQWLEIDACIKVMQPFAEILKIWSEENTTNTASSLIPLVAALRDSLQADLHNFVSSVTISALARKLLDELNVKFSHLSTDMKYLMATYLDPRYKQAFFSEQQEQMVVNEVLKELCQNHHTHTAPPLKVLKLDTINKNESKIDTILDNILTSPSINNNSINQEAQFKNLLYLYNSEPRIERNSNPLIWWQNNIKFSSLYPLVRQHLSAPAAANVECEKLLKSSAHIYGDLESGLSTENASKIILIKSNLNTLYSDGN